jgi:acyl-CoA synthetase (AMP-forming)/AMP-acid ligase II
LHHGYGLSEYAGALCLGNLNVARDDTSAGYLVDGAGLRIVNEQGQDAATGERGEIWMRGVGLMPGYFRDAEATAQVMREGGWYASGDVGYLDDGGALFVVGRLKEMIIRSGFNVYPGEVESVLSQFPGVQRAAVVGRAVSGGNEEIMAFLEMQPHAELDRAALASYVADHLAPYKRPAHTVVSDGFPMTLSGKVLKRELLASFEAQSQ